MITRAKISAVRAPGVRRRAALINFFVPDAALTRGRHLIEGGAYLSKYGTLRYLRVGAHSRGVWWKNDACIKMSAYLVN